MSRRVEPYQGEGSCAGWIRYKTGDFSLDAQWNVPPGQVLTLFGPSGAGKTTLLRAIAGLVKPQEGHVEVNGRIVFDGASGNWVRPHERRIGLLTQQYHLFPHLTLADNIGYGLAGQSKSQRQQRVEELVSDFRLSGLEKRRPAEISAGQQQRVALARALAPKPALVLLDEPFSSLDIELRRNLRLELRASLAEANVPAIMVTHDIEEAITVGDSVQVIHDGKVGAAGNPLEVLGQPGQGRVARLVGVENLLDLLVDSRHPLDGTMVCNGSNQPGIRLEVPLFDAAPGDRITVGIRASDIILADSEPRGSSARNRLAGVVSDVQLRPPGYQVRLDCNGVDLRCHITGTSLNEMGIAPGSNLWAVFKASSCFLVVDDD